MSSDKPMTESTDTPDSPDDDDDPANDWLLANGHSNGGMCEKCWREAGLRYAMGHGPYGLQERRVLRSDGRSAERGPSRNVIEDAMTNPSTPVEAARERIAEIIDECMGVYMTGRLAAVGEVDRATDRILAIPEVAAALSTQEPVAVIDFETTLLFVCDPCDIVGEKPACPKCGGDVRIFTESGPLSAALSPGEPAAQQQERERRLLAKHIDVMVKRAEVDISGSTIITRNTLERVRAALAAGESLIARLHSTT